MSQKVLVSKSTIFKVGQNLLARILGDVNGNNLVSKVLKMLYITVHSLT